MKQRAHVIKLKPNNKQATYFEKACGCQRFVYNYGLAAWKTGYEDGSKPTGRGLKKQFNGIKHTEYPWIAEVTKCVVDSAFENLNRAFQNFFRTRNGKTYPKFHKKGVNDSFTVDNTKFVVDGKKIRIPKLGWVRMTEELRFNGKLMSATVKKRAGKWFVSIAVETAATVSENQASGAVGIDLGVKTLATLSAGIVFENPKTYYKYDKQLRRSQKSLSRKKKGSKNRAKAKLKLSKIHYRISCVVDDYIHKMTRRVANDYHTVVLEDLNVKGMLKNRHLSKAVSRSNFHKIRQFIQYKCGDVRFVDRFYASSKTCSACGRVKEMPLHLRTYDCECGLSLCRDLNAARNILAQGLGQVKPVEMKALSIGNGSETVVCEAGNVLKTQRA
jgi:putative transposase